MKHMVRWLVCLATVAGLSFGAFGGYSSADYSQDGLELHLDAIDNAGTGEHDSAATVWKDLAGKHDFTLASGGSWSGGNSFYMNGSCAATAADLIPNTYLTAEVVYASTGKKSGYILFTGNNLRALYDEAGARLWYSTTTSSGVTSEACASPTGTNHFAAVYAVGGDLLEQVYADGASTDGCAHSDNWNSYTKYAVLGARGTGTDAPSQARVFAIRLYNRKLSADEIRRHYALDRARFFGDTTLIDQLSSFVMGAIPAQKILSGSYAEPLPEVTDVKTGATLTRGTDYEITYRDNAAPGTATVVVTGKGAYVGLSRTTTFEITRVRASEYVAGSYVRTGLIAQFDGVENAGIALPHDPELYGWKDLSGHEWDWVFRTPSEFGTKMKWNDDSLFINSTCGATIGNSPFAKMVTVEFVWRSNGTSQGIIMSPGFGQGPNLEMGNGYICVYGSDKYHASYPAKSGETHITHVVYSGTTPNVEGSGVAALYVDGQLVETPGTSGGAFNCQKDGAALSGRSNNPQYGANGNLYALRVYDRELTPQEIWWNYAVDRDRFFGDRSALCDMAVDPIPDQYAVGAIAARPVPVVKDRWSGEVLKEGTDYSVAWSNNTSVGMGYVIVTGIGDQTNTETVAAFTISRPDITIAELPPQNVRGATRAEPKPAVTVAGTEVALVEGTDFAYSYLDNTAPGTAKVVVTGIGDYEGIARTNDFTVASINADQYVSENYIRNGLLVQLDGIDNAGIGLHDESTNVWKDLKGTLDFTLRGKGAFTDNALSYSGSSATAASVPPAYKTIEAVFTLSSNNNRGFVLYTFNKSSGLVADPRAGYGHVWFSAQPNSKTAIPLGTYNDIHHVAAGFEDGVPTVAWRNGEPEELVVHADDLNVDNNCQYAIIGDRTTGSSWPTSGKLYALRLYDRVLSADEIKWNYAVDRARFFGDPSLCAEISLGVRVEPVPEQGYDGVHPCEPKPVVFDTHTQTEMRLGVDYEVVYHDNAAAGTATLDVIGIGDNVGRDVRDVPFTVVRRGYGGIYTASSYLQDGLVAQWDAIENAGRGQPHDSTATEWADLCGGDPYVLSAKGAWGDDEVSFRTLGSSVAANRSTVLKNFVTAEICFCRPSAATSDTILWNSGQGGPASPTYAWGSSTGDGKMIVRGYDLISAPTMVDNTVAAVYDVSAGLATDTRLAYVNGESVEISDTGLYYNAGQNVCTLGGGNQGRAVAATVYAIRLYDHELTAEEIAYNHAIDAARFFLDPSKLPQFFVETVPAQLGDGIHGCEPELVVRDAIKDVVLTRGKDYEVVYADNVLAGTATATVTGIGDYEGKGSVSAKFTVRTATYVAATAQGRGDGSSWANTKTLADAAATAVTDEIFLLKAETFALAEGVTFAVPCKIWGGYSGSVSDPLERADGAKTVLDGGGTVPTLVTLSANTSAADRSEIRDIVFTDAKLHGLVKSGATGLLMEDCDFVRNGLADTGYTDGRGAQIAGSANTVATLRNCMFRYNMVTNSAERFANGVGLNVGTFKRVELENCSFVGNGLAPWLKGSETQYVCFGAALYSTAPILASGCEFRLNHAPERNDKRGGAVCLAGGTGHVFSNCTFVANSGTFMRYYADTGGGTVRVAIGVANSVAFERCTFAYNLSDSASCANVNVVSGRAFVRNCIFSDAIVSKNYTGGRYIHVYSGSYCEVSDTLFPSGSEADAVFAVRETDVRIGKNVHYADAGFVTPSNAVAPWAITEADGTLYFDPEKTDELEAIDVHLRNSDGVYSAAIDQGAEEDPVGDEPMPNANRLNLGAYGGTAEAATSAPDAATVAEFAVTWADGYTLPKYAVKLGGAEGALYNADIEVFCATGGQVAAGEWTKVGRVYGLHKGGSAEIQQDFPLLPGDGYTMRVIAYNGPTWVTNDITGTVEGELPPWYGKGGTANVLHVWAGAVYEPDGSNWAHAYRTLADAVAAWDESKTEIWIAGDLEIDALVTFKPSVDVAIRGGFTGAENTAEARLKGVKSTLDGAYRSNILSLQTASAVTLDGLRFVRSSKTALEKTGAGDLTLVGCEIVDCGTQAVNYNGHGANLQGSDGATLTITGCLFAGNVQRSYSNNAYGGMALYLSGFASATIDATAFETNGIPFTADTGVYMNNFAGVAIYDNGVPLTLTHCRFRGNRGTSAANRGGIVVLSGAVGGSTVENCAFIGNQDIMKNASTGPAAGALVVSAAADAEVLVKNCTFARNVTSSPLAAAALSVAAGDVSVRNCIFHGNVPAAGASVARDLTVAEGATLALSYSMFDCTATTLGECVSAPEGASLGEGTHTFGDPLFAVDALEDGDVITTATESYLSRTAATLGRVMAIDVHLRSPKGYFLDDGGEVVVGADLSPAIDTGDPGDPVVNEPDPNGARINLGAYGNTAEASKTSVGQPEIESVEVEMQEGGWSRPEVRVTLGGEASAKYNAEVTIVGTIGGVEVCRYVKAGVQNGETVIYAPEAYYDKGQILAVSVTVKAGGAETRGTSAPVEVEITGERPPWDGRGGDPATTLHVWADAPFAADGRTWASAYRTLPAALAAMDATKSEIWITGDCPIESGITLAPSASLAIRGGFTAAETDPGQRPAGARSTVDANKAVATHFTLANGAGIAVTLDGLGLVQSTTRAISKSASVGDLMLVGCLLASNGLAACNDGGGHGLYATGSGAARLVVSNCVFRDQTYASQCGGGLNNGGAINATSFARVEIVGSSFVNNGGTYGSGVGTQHAYRNSSGRAVYVKDSPVWLRGCSFLGNRGTAGCIGGNVGNKLSGGTVALVGACGGSEIRNCRFLGNANDFVMGGGSQSTYSTYGGGALLLNLTDATQAATVENCTFAWNVGDAYLAAAGVSVATGRADIRNCVFAHNRVGTCTIAAKDVSFGEGAEGSVSYSLFDGALEDCVSQTNATVELKTDTLKFDDPLFVSTNRMDDLVKVSGNLTYFNGTAAVQAALEALDCHLCGGMGYFDEASPDEIVLSHRRPHSPAIDAGDPASDFSLERETATTGNGGRVNLGAYGNSPWATMSRVPGSFLRVR